MNQGIESGIINRESRRAQKYSKVIARQTSVDGLKKGLRIVNLNTIDSILENGGEDIQFYNQEFNIQQYALNRLQIERQIMMVLQNMGVRPDTIRDFVYSRTFKFENYPKVYNQLVSETNPRAYDRSVSVLNVLQRKIKSNVRFFPEETEVWELLLKDPEINTIDLFAEAIRSTKENTALIKLQIDWITEKARLAVAKSQTPIKTSTDDSQIAAKNGEITNIAESFALKDWQLYWTNRHWSTQPQHLIHISTDSYEEALTSIKSITLGEVMIKPASVLRAIEFYLGKDVLQKALSARVKYAPEQTREWIKIKRGKDRIMVHEPVDQNVIFFAGNRDSIYERI